MRHIFLGCIAIIAMLLTLGSCHTTQTIEEDNSSTSIQAASPKLIGDHLEYLASDERMGRRTGTTGIAESADYIQKKLAEYGWLPYDGSYRHDFTVNEVKGENIVAVLPGKHPDLKKEIVVVGAHYDHIGIVQAVAGDSIANGANDNATGTATVMEFARLFKDLDNKRTVMVALFSAEEMGLLGSKALASDMKADGEQVYAVVNFEMTGVPMNGNKMSYITGYDKSNMADIFNQHIKNDTITGYLPQAAEFSLFRRSDNYPFFLEFGVPSQTICTFDFTNYAYYHKPGDEIQLMDTEHMATLIDALVPGMVNIINGENLQLTAQSNE
jgi:putative aminopeptidase FrvX